MKNKLLLIKTFSGHFSSKNDFSDVYPFSDRGFEVIYKSAASTSDVLDIIQKSFPTGREFDVIVLTVESMAIDEDVKLDRELVSQVKRLLDEINRARDTPILLVGVQRGLASTYFQTQNKLFDGFFLSDGSSYEQQENIVQEILLRSGINISEITKDNIPLTISKKPVGKSFDRHNKKALYIEWPPQSNFWGCRVFQEIGFEVTFVFVENLSEALSVEDSFSISFSSFDIIIWAIAGLDKLSDVTFPESLVSRFKSKLEVINQNREYPVILIGQHKALNLIFLQSQLDLFDGYFFTNIIYDEQRAIIQKIIK
jgi:hypothetical protein